MERPEPAIEEFETIVIGGGQAGLVDRLLPEAARTAVRDPRRERAHRRRVAHTDVGLAAAVHTGALQRAPGWTSRRPAGRSRPQGRPPTTSRLTRSVSSSPSGAAGGSTVSRAADGTSSMRRASSQRRAGRRRHRLLRDTERARLRRRARPPIVQHALERVPPPVTAARRARPPRRCRQLGSRHRDGGRPGFQDVAVGAGQGPHPGPDREQALEARRCRCCGSSRRGC